jgi:dolichol-phosphate mannosyltransferase
MCAVGTHSLAVVLPAYDESENLRILLPELRSVLDSLVEVESTILVVLPLAATVVEQQEVVDLGAVCVIRGPSDTFGDAVRSGIKAVPITADYIIFMDADGSHSPTTVPRLVEFADGNDVVIASRYVRGGKSDNGPLLRAMSRSLNMCFRIVLRVPCDDLSTSFKLYKREQLQAITLTCDKFDIVEEILFRLQRKVGRSSFRVHEVPDYFRERKFGESKRQLGPFIVSYFLTLIRLRMSRN